MSDTRTVHDSLGAVEVPADALYGAQTQRAVANFTVSGRRLPRPLIEALGLIKAAYAEANGAAGHLADDVATAVATAARSVAAGHHDGQFPVDIFQTGSGTSSNMNANEVVATLAARALGRAVHPNDEVNLGQSSNDVIPSATHLAATLELGRRLLPALDGLVATCRGRALELAGVVKTGRTHLMDAMPVTLGQEVGAWAAQLDGSREELERARDGLHRLALGGTAVGTGVNADPRAVAAAVARLTEWTGLPLVRNPSPFAGLATLAAVVATSGALRGLAVNLIKVANDLRWMASGPNAGLGEITLPALQPGSSIMPGKVNPVIPEAVAMVGAEVIGNDTAITVAAQSGNFQLNVMWPLAAWNLLTSIDLLGAACALLDTKAIAGFQVNAERLAATLSRNPILVTALAPRIGYELAAKIAKRAYDEGRPVIDVAADLTDIGRDELERLLDPLALTGGGG
jgi:fumarate hydratase class II